MKVGLFLSAQAPIGERADERFRTLVHQVRLAEELGFHSVFLGHHYLTSSQFFQPIALASHLAAITERIRLGFGVLLSPLLHPLALAEELATIDVISGGRLTVGVGAGYREVEFGAFGIPYGSRRDRMVEGIELMKALWDGERVSYDGRFGTVDGARVTMRPIQVGGPPIWIGAFGPKAIARAAQLGLPWLASPEGTIDVLEDRYAAYRAGLRASGHRTDLPYPMSREAAVAPTTAEAADSVRPFLEQQYRGYRQWDQVRDLSIDDVIAEHALVGTPAAVIARLGEYADRLGVTEVILRVDWLGMDPAIAERTIRLVGTEVVPSLHRAGAAP